MKTVTQYIRDHILRDVNKPEPVGLKEMYETQWSHEFVQYMRNRMTVGGYRYGRINDPSQPKFDNIGSILVRANLYFETGNQEHLVDIANLALIEFVRGCCHPNPHWSPGDDGYHTEKIEPWNSK